jgi:hypothetical protein
MMKYYQIDTQTAYGRTYTFRHEVAEPAAFASPAIEQSWGLKEHALSCSMYTYVQRAMEHESHYGVEQVEWLARQMAFIMKENQTEVRKALLGFPHIHSHGERGGPLLGVNEAGCIANPLTPQAATGTGAALPSLQ